MLNNKNSYKYEFFCFEILKLDYSNLHSLTCTLFRSDFLHFLVLFLPKNPIISMLFLYELAQFLGFTLMNN